MRIVSVVGARPQFVKLAPVAAAAAAAGVEHLTVHTGQHYDAAMSDVFFEQLAIPEADVNLGIGSGTHGRQTGQMLERLEATFDAIDPDWVLVYGDTNSTVAAALAAVKMHLPLAHLEAGLRSFNRRMPEEHNRVLTDHAADLLLAPSEVAVTNLRREGLGERTVHVGDVMVDVACLVRDDVLADPPAPIVTDGSFVLATIHRAENTDDPERLDDIITALAGLPQTVVLPAHPRLLQRCADHRIDLRRPGLHVVEPLPYREMVAAVLHADRVVTDSGGLQKEAFVLGTPCVTVRTETEWLETVELGWNALAEPAEIADLIGRPVPAAPTSAPYGDGRAAAAVIETLSSRSAGA